MNGSLRTYLKYGIPPLAVALLVALVLVPRCSNAQSLQVNYGGTVSIWNKHTDCVQHTSSSFVEVEGEVPYVFIELRGEFQWWGACDSKIPSSPLNAESGMANTRKRQVNVGFQYKNFQVGGTYRRRQDQVTWRHAGRERHRYFPSTWRVGKQACSGGSAPNHPEGDPQCPSLGYEDGLRPYIGYEGRGVDVALMGPIYTWKTLTLPWPHWIARSVIEYRKWRFSGYAQVGGPDENAGWVRATRVVYGPLRIGAEAGRAATFGWRKRGADYIAISLVITN